MMMFWSRITSIRAVVWQQYLQQTINTRLVPACASRHYVHKAKLKISRPEFPETGQGGSSLREAKAYRKIQTVKRDIANYFKTLAKRSWNFRSDSFYRNVGHSSAAVGHHGYGVGHHGYGVAEFPNPVIPDLTPETAKAIVERLYDFKVQTVHELDSYADRNFFISVDDADDNRHFMKPWPYGYTLKILNSEESQTLHYEAEHDMLKILSREGFRCPQPVLNVFGQDSSLESLPGSAGDVHDSVRHRCRLMTYVPGKVLHDVPYTSSLMYDAGEYLARVQQALQGYHHPALSSYDTIWSLSSFPRMMSLIELVPRRRHRQLARQVLETFRRQVVPRYSDFRKGAIHGDFNDFNVIVQEDPHIAAGQNQHKIHGIIDFGDSTEGYYVFDVAIAIMYLSLETTLADAGRYFLQGYLSQAELNPEEMAVLRTCVAARYAQSAVMAEYSSSRHPENTYLQETLKGWTRLEELWATPADELYSDWGFTI